MRPLELVLEGFRSHHERHTFGWTGRHLVGIVGPIGSGKSSILDAISFALFGKTPVFEKDRKALINQRSEAMRVELAFEVDGVCWRVLRLVRRRGAARHTLLRHEDADLHSPHAEEASGDREVTARVEQLLGLDFTSFCRSALLAQNRFSDLLGSRPAHRDDVLKQLFGFERVGDLRAAAKQRLAAATARAEELQKRADDLEQDRLRLEAMRLELAAAVDRVAALDRAGPRIKELERTAAEARQAVERAGQELQQLERTAAEAPGADRVGRLARARVAADAALEEAEGAARLAAGQVHTAEQERAATEEAVGSSEALSRAEGLIDRLEDRQRSLSSRAERQRGLAAEIETVGASLDQHRADVVAAEAALEQARTAAAAGQQAHEQAQQALVCAEAEVGDARALEGRRQQLAELQREGAALVQEAERQARLERDQGQAAGALEQARAALARTREQEEAAAAGVRAAWQALEAAEQALHRAQHAEMALELRGELRAGVTCPVCEQTVSAVPPGTASPDLQAARDAVARSRGGLDAAEAARRAAAAAVAGKHSEVGGCDGALARAGRELEAVRADREAREARAKQLEAGLRQALGAGDLALQLEQAAARHEAVLAAVAQQQEALRRAGDAVTALQHALELARQALNAVTDGLAGLSARTTELEQERADLAEQRAGLAHQLAQALGPGEPREVLAAARARLQGARLGLQAARSGQKAADHALAAARAQQEAARAEAEACLGQLWGIAGRLGQRHDASLALAELAVRVEQLLTRERERWTEAAALGREQLDGHGTAHAGLLRELGLDADASFELALGEAREAHQRLDARVGDIELRLEQGGELGRKIEQARGHAAIYNQLVDDLVANRFVAYLLEEERTSLTELGSERLELLTAGRYRFAPDGSFDVLDLANAEARRDAKTLSGGETFLASLALALALAERVARSGGRLDAFFLDEGFGSLDPPHLDLALDGIERLVQDSPTRLVALVSHVEALRERVDDLIVLDRHPVTGDTVVVE